MKNTIRVLLSEITGCRRVIRGGLPFRFSYETIPFRALTQLKEAVTLQKEVLDTKEELIITHQATASVLRGLGREEDAEREMERAAECVKSLSPLEVALEANENRDENELMTASVSPSKEQGVSKLSTVCFVI